MDNKRNIFIYALQKTIPVMVGYLFLGMAYGISMLEKYSGTGSRKPYLIFGLTDETFSVICAEKVPEHMDRGKLYMLITTGSHGIPECAAVALTAILQVWKKNVLLSIGVGTVCYMLLVQFVFL